MTNQSFSHRGRETPAFRFLRCENCREVASALAVVEGDHLCLLTKPQGSYLSEGDTIRPGRIVKVPSGPPCLGKNWDLTGTGNTLCQHVCQHSAVLVKLRRISYNDAVSIYKMTRIRTLRLVCLYKVTEVPCDDAFMSLYIRLHFIF